MNAPAGNPKAEIRFLDGPQSRWKEFLFAVKAFTELIKGFRALHFSGPCITFFGSARFTEEHPYYQQTRKIAGEVARMGFTIMTGGGPGLMEAANRGAKEAGGRSVGCNIRLPREQKPNPYLDKWVTIDFFFIRKILLAKYSYAFIVMPGGFGTLDEYFEALTLVQTNKIDDFPIIVYGTEYHRELSGHVERMRKKGTISGKDTHLFMVTDSVEDIVKQINRRCIKKYGLKPAHKAISWLFEKAWPRGGY